jgi:hypothetical protein
VGGVVEVRAGGAVVGRREVGGRAGAGYPPARPGPQRSSQLVRCGFCVVALGDVRHKPWELGRVSGRGMGHSFDEQRLDQASARIIPPNVGRSGAGRDFKAGDVARRDDASELLIVATDGDKPYRTGPSSGQPMRGSCTISASDLGTVVERKYFNGDDLPGAPMQVDVRDGSPQASHSQLQPRLTNFLRLHMLDKASMDADDLLEEQSWPGTREGRARVEIFERQAANGTARTTPHHA